MSVSKQNKSALQEKKGISAPEALNKKSAEKIKTKRRIQASSKVLIQQIKQGDKIALSKAITLIESTAAKHEQLAQDIIEGCLPFSGHSIRIGITGVPGVGKSTFIESFGNLLIKQGRKVAVLAIDPSSSLSKGSILGDKTRMQELVKEENAFIRPTASGETLGGVAQKTREAIILCEAAGFNTIIIETVGVGQSEIAVDSMCDFFLLLKLAGAGDQLQGIKRGIIEMANLIAINKADGENLKAAQLAKVEFTRALHLYPSKENGWQTKTALCSALNHKGITEINETIKAYIKLTQENGFFYSQRKTQNKYWLLQTINNKLKSDFYNSSNIQLELKKLIAEVEKNKISPFKAAKKLLILKNK